MAILCISLVLTVADQVSKLFAQRHLVRGPRHVIEGLFTLRYVQNTGAAWGMLEGLNDWLVVLSFVMLVLIVIFRRSLLIDTTIHRVATGLMVGGIAGNLIDRIRLGYVVDFLDFHWRGSHFPAFNVADSAICVGVGLYLLSQFFVKPAPESHGETAPAKQNG